MKQIKISWVKEFKNCVPFFIYINGQERGIIKRGEEIVFDAASDNLEFYFVPKAPKWFGWKALKLQLQLTADYSVLSLGVQVPNNSPFGLFIPQKLKDAANINNQLHYIDAQGVEITDGEYIKKYR